MKKAIRKKARKVTFALTTEPDSEVFVAGTFNNWDPAQYQLRHISDDGQFRIELPLPPGRHEYKFIVDGSWRLDPTCPDCQPNGAGALNSVIWA